MTAPIVVIGGIHLVNSSGTPTAGGVATAAATTPFAIRHPWHPMPAEPIVIPGAQLEYPDVHYEPVADPPIPISVIGSDHENAVARLQELKRALMPRDGIRASFSIQPTSSSTAMQAEILSAIVRPVPEEDSNFEDWEGFAELHAEIVYTRTAFFGKATAVTLINGLSVTNTGTGTPDNIEAYGTGLDGDLSHQGQPTRIILTPASSTAFTIFYLASVYRRTYSTTGSGAKTTSSTTGASSALNAPDISPALTQDGIKARALFRFTNNTSNVQVRVEVRASTAGTLIYAGKWVTPTSGSATLYDMGRIPLNVFREASDNASLTLQLYIGYRSTDGASATATLGYNEFLLYYDFCRVDSSTAINASGGSSGFALVIRSYYLGAAALPLDAPSPYVLDIANTAIADLATMRGRAPRAIEGGSIYVAWMAAGNVHDTAKTGTIYVQHAPLWRTLRGSD